MPLLERFKTRLPKLRFIISLKKVFSVQVITAPIMLTNFKKIEIYRSKDLAR